MSAVDAWNSAGYESDAIVEAEAAYIVFIDAAHGGSTSGATVGYLLFPELALNPFDTALDVLIKETDPVTTVSRTSSYSAPHRELSHPLLGDRYYEIQVFYSAKVPYGIDPYYSCPYSYSTSYHNPYSGGVAPEPSSIVVLVTGLLLIRRSIY